MPIKTKSYIDMLIGANLKPNRNIEGFFFVLLFTKAGTKEFPTGRANPNFEIVFLKHPQPNT